MDASIWSCWPLHWPAFQSFVEVHLLHDISDEVLARLLSIGILASENRLLELLNEAQNQSVAILAKQHLNSTGILQLLLLQQRSRSLRLSLLFEELGHLLRILLQR